MLKRFSMLFFVMVLTLTVAIPAYASGDGPTNSADPDSGGMGGVVRPRGPALSASNALATPLTYHNGPVMHTNTTYAIYWVPAGYTIAPGYDTTINSYFMNVAAASGHPSNVYWASTQYYSNPGAVHIKYKSTFGGAVIDTNPFPASGCPLYTPARGSVPVLACLTDAQIRAEIKVVIASMGWTPSPTKQFFMFTPNNVGSCFGSSCAFDVFCAYHSYTGKIIYANQPYTDSVPNACGLEFLTATPPNGFAADATINVVSHEHNEAITDPRLNAWWDGHTGDENGDKCAWKFGPLTLGVYNQTINGAHYILQKEWTNAHMKCVLHGL